MRLIYWDLTDPEQSYVIGDVVKSIGTSILSSLINAETSANSMTNSHLADKWTNSFSHTDDQSVSFGYATNMARSKRGSQKSFSFNQGTAKKTDFLENSYNSFQQSSCSKSHDESCMDDDLLNSTIKSNNSTTMDSFIDGGGGIETEHDSADEYENDSLVPSPKRSIFKITNQDCIVKIEETEISSTKPNSINSQELDAGLDLELYSVQHDDSIMDIISVQDYLISCGRNGIINIWQ